MRKSEDDSELVEACESIAGSIERMGAPYGGLDYVCAAIKEGLKGIEGSLPSSSDADISILSDEIKEGSERIATALDNIATAICAARPRKREAGGF
jgi:hypothetical protein